MAGEEEILQVKLIQTFAPFWQIVVPIFVAFVTTIIAHTFLSIGKEKERKRKVLNELIDLYMQFQIHGLPAMYSTKFILQLYKPTKYKINITEKDRNNCLENMSKMYSLYHAVIAYHTFYADDFSKDLNQEIHNLANFINGTHEPLKKLLLNTNNVTDDLVNQFIESMKKIEDETVEVMP